LTTRLLLVLHGHLPCVVGHGTWPHGANWIYEAAAETYMPFLRNVTRLRAEGVPVCATVGMTPVLAEQLQDERFKVGFRFYLRQRARAARADRDHFLKTGESPHAEVAEGWRRFYTGLREDFEALPDRDILAIFRKLSDEGVIEPIASAATHGFLPLLPNDIAIERQLDIGLAAHARHFGKPARGVWLPECAYRAAGPWVSPATGRMELRRGLEDFLVDRGVDYFFVETHLINGGVTIPAYGGRIVREGPGRTPYRVYAVGTGNGRHVNVLARDPVSSQQVWSGIVGYPGDPRYLEFHKKRHPSGHRYWSVTDSQVDLADKLPYEPLDVPKALKQHAKHFVTLLQNIEPLDDGSDPIAVGMFDFELFGHWWFEGVDFLAEVFREIEKTPGIEAATVSEGIAASPPRDLITMPAGTWGRNGSFEVWWNPHTLKYWKSVEEIERQMELFESRRESIQPPLFAALERETLLLQSSDWPFLIDNEVSRDYAEERINRHALDFHRLAIMAKTGIADRETWEEISHRDRVFGPELLPSGEEIHFPEEPPADVARAAEAAARMSEALEKEEGIPPEPPPPHAVAEIMSRPPDGEPIGDADYVRAMVDRELARFRDAGFRVRARELRVPPAVELHGWEYGDLAMQYPCWVVIAEPPCRHEVAYCEEGFGPSHPWGVVVAGSRSLGLDTSWFQTLEEAFVRSGLAFTREGYGSGRAV